MGAASVKWMENDGTEYAVHRHDLAYVGEVRGGGRQRNALLLVGVSVSQMVKVSWNGSEWRLVGHGGQAPDS